MSEQEAPPKPRGRPRKNPAPEAETVQPPPPAFRPGPASPEDEAEAQSGLADAQDGQALAAENPEAQAEADLARRRGLDRPEPAEQDTSPRVILALRSTCVCGTTLARLKGENTWSCLRKLTGDSPRKACQSGIPLEAVIQRPS